MDIVNVKDLVPPGINAVVEELPDGALPVMSRLDMNAPSHVLGIGEKGKKKLAGKWPPRQSEAFRADDICEHVITEGDRVLAPFLNIQTCEFPTVLTQMNERHPDEAIVVACRPTALSSEVTVAVASSKGGLKL